MQNYFIKLLMHAVSDKEYSLLYGFSVPTDLPAHEWIQCKGESKKEALLAAILPQNVAEEFFCSLTNSEILKLGPCSFKNSGLVKREEVLVNDGETISSGPVKTYAKLTEYWNVNKRDTLQSIREMLGSKDAEIYKNLQTILNWVTKESGTDFRRDGWKFGNFECYFIEEDSKFELVRMFEADNFKITAKKKVHFPSPLIVNFIASQGNRTLKNEVHILCPEERETSFCCSIFASQITVNIWNEESSDLIFSVTKPFTKQICIRMGFESTPYRVRDDWSANHYESASKKGKARIEQQVEAVFPVSEYDELNIKEKGYDIFDEAYHEGSSLFSESTGKKTIGAFIQNENRNGEIESYLKIREYIEHSNISKVIIADPYFSVEAASKILCRISNTDLQVEIITSLTDKNPDTDEEDDNIVKEFRDFLQKNKSLLPNKLTVINLTNRKRQVFHDRYLIRYYKDGGIDGFLLSNSLNSMGASYPFVIEVMEQEVCLEVGDYLHFISNPDSWTGTGTKCDILCDFPRQNEDDDLPSAIEKSRLDMIDCVNKWLTEDVKAIFDEDLETDLSKMNSADLYKIISALMEHWNEDSENICCAICILGGMLYDYQIKDIADIIKTVDPKNKLFVKEFVQLAEQTEKNIVFISQGIDSEVYKLWALLNDKADPDRQGFSQLFDEAGNIYYREDYWLGSGYEILLRLDPLTYIGLLKTIKSPLMFDIVIFYMMFYKWNDALYDTFIGSGDLLYQLSGAECLFRNIMDGDITNIQVKNILNRFPPEKRIFQTVHLLSKVIFHVRSNRKNGYDEKWDELSNQFLELVALDLPVCDKNMREHAMKWLYDPKKESNCVLYLCLAEKIPDSNCWKELIEKELELAEYGLLEISGFGGDTSELISLYLSGLDALEDEVERKQLFEKIIDKRTFELATEPQLEVYDHDKSHKARMRAKLQMDLLRAFHEKYPDDEEVTAWLQTWEPYEQRW